MFFTLQCQCPSLKLPSLKKSTESYKLNVDSPSKFYLITASKTLEKTNNNTITTFVNDCLRVL